LAKILVDENAPRDVRERLSKKGFEKGLFPTATLLHGFNSHNTVSDNTIVNKIQTIEVFWGKKGEREFLLVLGLLVSRIVSYLVLCVSSKLAAT
jgi:hypothetical protein